MPGNFPGNHTKPPTANSNSRHLRCAVFLNYVYQVLWRVWAAFRGNATAEFAEIRGRDSADFRDHVSADFVWICNQFTCKTVKQLTCFTGHCLSQNDRMIKLSAHLLLRASYPRASQQVAPFLNVSGRAKMFPNKTLCSNLVYKLCKIKLIVSAYRALTVNQVTSFYLPHQQSR